MVRPNPPIDLSANSIKSTTNALNWSAGITVNPPTQGYRIERSLNGGSFIILVGNTGNTLTDYVDSTQLSPRDNAKYRVSAINNDGTSDPSNIASATTSTSEAQILKQLLFDEWSLTGELSKTVVGDMTEPVNFFDRDQVPGNKKTKAVVVQKVNELGNEIVVEHPRFSEVRDIFEITCFLQVTDSADDIFSNKLDLLQQMTSEVTRILKTRYSPSSGVGEYFRTQSNWTRDNTFFTDDPELTRTLRFTLTKLVSNDDSVHIGYPDQITDVEGVLGILVFDTSESQGDEKPDEDYAFVQVQNIQRNEGWSQIAYLTNDVQRGRGVPHIARGIFSGAFTAETFAKKDDILGDTIEKLANIYKPQSNSPIRTQLAEVVLLQNNVNTEEPKSVLEVTSFMRINRIYAVSTVETLVKYRIEGTLTRPSTYGEISDE